MTTPTKELLAQLNAHRVATGGKELKAWKESRAKLEAAVAAIPKADDDPTGSTAPVDAVTLHNLGDTAEGKANEDSWKKENGGPVKTKKPPKEKKPARDTTGTRTIPELCRALGKREKVGRAKCRRWGSKLRPLMEPGEGWRFKNENLAAVCAILDWQPPADWTTGN